MQKSVFPAGEDALFLFSLRSVLLHHLLILLQKLLRDDIELPVLGHAVGDVVLHQLRLLMAAEGQLEQNRRQDRAAYDRDDDRRHHRGRQHTHRKAAVGDDQRDFAAAGHAHADLDALARAEMAGFRAKAAAEELRDDRNKQQQNSRRRLSRPSDP